MEKDELLNLFKNRELTKNEYERLIKWKEGGQLSLLAKRLNYELNEMKELAEKGEFNFDDYNVIHTKVLAQHICYDISEYIKEFFCVSENVKKVNKYLDKYCKNIKHSFQREVYEKEDFVFQRRLNLIRARRSARRGDYCFNDFLKNAKEHSRDFYTIIKDDLEKKIRNKYNMEFEFKELEECVERGGLFMKEQIDFIKEHNQIVGEKGIDKRIKNIKYRILESRISTELKDAKKNAEEGYKGGAYFGFNEALEFAKKIGKTGDVTKEINEIKKEYGL
jgi:hypothetical protein